MAAQLGYCGLDRARAPLSGAEIRPCWEAGASVPADPARPLPVGRAMEPGARRQFVEIGGASVSARDDGQAPPAPAQAPAHGASSANGPARSVGPSPAARPVEARWSLWSEFDA